LVYNTNGILPKEIFYDQCHRITTGNYFEDEGALYQVLDILLNKTAMRKMVAKIKVKNLRTGAIFELARNSGYGVEEVRLDKKNMQYLYDAGETLCFMDGKTFEQIELPKANLQNEIPYLAPNGEVIIVSYNDEILGIQLPPKSPSPSPNANRRSKAIPSTAR
jgi:elongation factor P